MKRLLKYAVIFIMLILIYLMSLMIASLIPRDLIENHVKESAEILSEEDNYKSNMIDLKVKTILLDNYTTALMINNAYSMDSSNPLASSLLVRKNYLPKITKIVHETSSKELEIASQVSSTYDLFDSVSELQGTVNGEITESYEYARYWHGYLAVLKPLLILFNLEQIKTISTLCIIAISIYLLWKIYQKIDKKTMILFLLGLLCCEIFLLGIELQGQLNIYIMLIVSIIILQQYNDTKKYNYCLLFFIIGSMTNFLDFFTIPAITYAIPLMIYFILDSKSHPKTVKDILKLVLKSGIAWVAGYALTWLAKWIIVDIIYNRNIFQNAMEQIKYRGMNLQFNYIQTVINNFVGLGGIDTAVIIYTVLYNIFLICYYRIKKEKIPIVNIVFYISISLIPFIWYFIVRQHSYLHAAFTYRLLYITIIANMLIFSENLSVAKQKK